MKRDTPDFTERIADPTWINNTVHTRARPISGV